MASGGMMLKFDPEEALKGVEEKIGRPMTEEEKTTCKDFMQAMLMVGMQAGQVFSLPTDEIGGKGEHGQGSLHDLIRRAKGFWKRFHEAVTGD